MTRYQPNPCIDEEWKNRLTSARLSREAPLVAGLWTTTPSSSLL